MANNTLHFSKIFVVFQKYFLGGNVTQWYRTFLGSRRHIDFGPGHKIKNKRNQLLKNGLSNMDILKIHTRHYGTCL